MKTLLLACESCYQPGDIGGYVFPYQVSVRDVSRFEKSAGDRGLVSQSLLRYVVMWVICLVRLRRHPLHFRRRL